MHIFSFDILYKEVHISINSKIICHDKYIIARKDHNVYKLSTLKFRPRVACEEEWRSH